MGKYLDLLDAYKSLIEAIKHAGIHTSTRVNLQFLDAEELEQGNFDLLHSADAILVPGGFGSRGFEGKRSGSSICSRKPVLILESVMDCMPWL